MQLRRVVTGHDEHGTSMVVSDEQLAPVAMGPSAWNCAVWGRDGPPIFPDEGAAPTIGEGFPPVGGTRFGVMNIASGGTAELDRWVVETYREGADPAWPGMHRTPSLDLIVVLQGEIVMQLDGGDEVTLHQHDFVIQNGTNHRWENRGAVDATIAVAVIGAAIEDVAAVRSR